MSRHLDDLDADVRRLALQLRQECLTQGIKIMFAQTYRTAEEQAALYAQGRTVPGKIVTNAPPGYSWHEFRRAFDVAEEDRTPSDIGAPGLGPEDEAWWNKVGDIGEAIGLEWGGRWKHPDRPHFQHTAGLTLGFMRANFKKP